MIAVLVLRPGGLFPTREIGALIMRRRIETEGTAMSWKTAYRSFYYANAEEPADIMLRSGRRRRCS